jgi:hypothetical protein
MRCSRRSRRSLDEQAAGLVDEEREKVMGSDEVGVNGEPEYSETVVEIVVPSMWPWSLRICSARLFTWSDSRWSTAAAMPVPPSCVTSSAVSSIVSARL